MQPPGAVPPPPSSSNIKKLIMSDNKTDQEQQPEISMLDQQQTAESFLQEKQARLAQLNDAATEERANLLLDIAEAYISLNQPSEAWTSAKQSFDIFIFNENWQGAVEACNVLYQSEQDDSIVALGQGLWLAVTFPIQADTTVATVQNLIDETPANADGAAVAAATAHYIAGLRTEGAKQESLTFLTRHILGQVAERHSQVQSQDEFEIWISRLQLDQPEEFLPRLATVIDVMVEDKWWFDRDQLRAKIPDQ